MKFASWCQVEASVLERLPGRNSPSELTAGNSSRLPLSDEEGRSIGCPRG